MRHVPGDYPGIQNAIDASANGDIILVSPGVYNENINFRGKAITVSSTNPADPTVVSNTVIHAIAKRSVVTFVTRESSNSVLTGFHITGGYGTINSSFDTTVFWGGGIYCYLSSPTITGNIISANAGPAGTNNAFGYGGGIGCLNCNATITRNLIAANAGYVGGGITVESGNPLIANNVISSNSAIFGGGATMFSGGQLINNTLVGNGAQFAGNVYAFSDYLGQSLITNNIICNATSGGGIYVDSQFSQMAFNDVWGNMDGDYPSGVLNTGLNGNISEDPQFVDAAKNDFHLLDSSPCINAGDPNFQAAPGETDFYGNSRLFAGRVDIGASEYSDHFRPIAQAGADQLNGVTHLPSLITLDGSGSSDPNAAALAYRWRQISGPAGSFIDASAVKPAFQANELGTYTFELIVNNGQFNSFPDTVQVTVKNGPPIAYAGADQMLSDQQPVASITLDGSRSFDPEGAALGYHWKQVSGWNVQLSDPNSANPTILHPWPGAYLFELVVNDGMQSSAPDVVAVVIGPNHLPIAEAGLPRYVATNSVTLDGTRSYDPDGYGTLTYQWRQLSGPSVTMTGTNTATPVVSGFIQRNTNQTCVFELTVSDGYLASLPSSVKVIIVKSFGTNSLKLVNPPFDSARPTILAFNGGNCTTGSGMTFGGIWEEKANWLTVDSYAPIYTRYADMLIVYLSSIAPDYHQPIQVMGWSTGNLPAINTAWWINLTYKDPRYTVNRVSLLDAVCGDLSIWVNPYNANRVAGEQCWVDNYISNDPGYSQATFLRGALNVICLPTRQHYYPVGRYISSSLDYENGGLTAFAYLSVIGAGMNYQLNTASNKCNFKIDGTESIVFFNQSLYPGKVLAPVQLLGPADGGVFDSGGVVLSCNPVENAAGYHLLLGSDPNRVMDFSLVSDTKTPPTQLISTLPQPQTWWTVKAYDQFGSTIYADPRLIKLPENRPPTANAGPDRIVYAGLDGQATVTFDGSKSSDPDADPLNFTWAWAIGGTAYLSNGVGLTIELPVGVHTVQLMVNDSHLNSEAAQVKITVVAPLECALNISPSTFSLKSNGQNILARVRFPEGFSAAAVDSDAPLQIFPGGFHAVRSWIANDETNQPCLFAFFDRAALSAELQDGDTELTVVGTLRSGQTFYARDTVHIIEPGKVK